MNNRQDKRNRLSRLWDWFWSPSTQFSVGFTLISGFLIGILFWGGFHWTIEASNSEEFCVSCHSMETNLGEYRQTVHYYNHSGVRAVCSDCHVPKEWDHKMKAKAIAVKDVFYELIGSIDTREKYEARRIDMAKTVWKKMRATDSRECRNCHAFEYMDFTIQETRASSEHQRGIDEGITCIGCHQGVAHKLPPNWLEEYEKLKNPVSATRPGRLWVDALANAGTHQSYSIGSPAE
ncbi:MAG: NapC/NirT family cytochrome c [Gammaproteobacteria bacterium]|nr:NapC/NirT family cytochrome c [Gammaproteobacteria bacterium]MCY4313436.1 NapC/NirT family cytochrome c [Gammaproteobacteria bacterium]